VVGFTYLLLYPEGDSPQYPLYGSLGGLQSPFESYVKEKKMPPPAKNRSPILRSPIPLPSGYPDISR
jgi:hypothetical protein